MSGEAINMGDLESLVEDLSDEQLASCVGGLGVSLYEGCDGTEGVWLGEDGNLVRMHLLGSVDLPIEIGANVLGTEMKFDTKGSFRSSAKGR